MANAFMLPKFPRDDALKDRTNLPEKLDHDRLPANKNAPDVETEQHGIVLSPPALAGQGGPSTVDGINAFQPRGLFGYGIQSSNAPLSHVLNLQSPTSDVTSVPLTAEALASGLHINTDFISPQLSLSPRPLESDGFLRHSASASSLPRRTPSARKALHSTAGSLSPGSVISSPQLAAMMDMTPLPSPVGLGRDNWKIGIPSRSRGSSTASRTETSKIEPQFSPMHAGPIAFSPPPRRKPYNGLQAPVTDSQVAQKIIPKSDAQSGHERTRSTSDYVPEPLAVPKPRHIAVSGSGEPATFLTAQSGLHREEYLAEQRGLTSPITKPPTPPRSMVGDYTSGEEGDEPASKRARTEIYTVQSLAHGRFRKYKSIKLLGQGTFSKVYLAVRQVDSGDDGIDYARDSTNMAGVRVRSRRLVAVKVVEHGPAGGADEERINVSLKREVDIMKAVQHPSLVHLKAFGVADDHRTLLVMNYCPGGDLFELASTRLDVLVPSLVRRIFSELVSAVTYLHQKFIVHRDIKLENVLLNIPVQVHPDVSDWQTLDRAVVTLTDLGLSRRIPEPPESPLLTTRCGSEDYAAPEILMGLGYDGRQTDAWALGVLLYALMEGRLPFDPLPGARGDPILLRKKTPHRIARCEWAWYKYGDEDGEWDPKKGSLFGGARLCVDGLLKRNTRRKSLDEIRNMEWIKDGVVVEGGLKWAEEETL